MSLPLHDRALEGIRPSLVRLTASGLAIGADFDSECETTFNGAPSFDEVKTALLPARQPGPGEQYRFHFDMTKCIGCRSCEIACNEQNGNPVDISWRRVGELEGGSYPETQRHYLSMGCNHCLDADCLRGCPVDAYSKDPITGIVLHSADACIGCSYCVWNCPYSVPQYNPERGVVGKCDLCKGRLDDGLEPACVHACPEGAIAIEIVNVAEWRADFTSAESPGMPAAEQTLSTTRITLPRPKDTQSSIQQGRLERVDQGQIQREHAHTPLIYMTTMMQAVAGALWVLLATHGLDALRLLFLLGITAAALTLSTLHLGRPAYAYRALKMWRRSWLSREVLLFTLFFAALTTAAIATGALQYGLPIPQRLVFALDLAAAMLGLAGTLVSAAIYLVAARPAWNNAHTPIDFVLTAALLGTLLAAVLEHTTGLLSLPNLLHFLASSANAQPPVTSVATCIAALWLINQGVRANAMRCSTVFEMRAAWDLLAGESLSPLSAIAATLLLVAIAATAARYSLLALAAGLGAILLTRYLFFVTVVPLNMALTFVRSRPAGAAA